jgi:5'(3')-deoxyribonucleotidase
MKDKISVVFIDLDGCLVDWLNGIRKSLKLPESFYDKYKENPNLLSRKDVDELFGGKAAFEVIQQRRDYNFWMNLDLFPWANDLITLMQANFPVAFLTSPGACPVSGHAKIDWRNKHYHNIPIMLCREKYLAAAPGKVLIDDEDGQVRRFNEAGGLAIQWPNQFKLLNLSEGEQKAVLKGTVQKIKDYGKTL